MSGVSVLRREEQWATGSVLSTSTETSRPTAEPVLIHWTRAVGEAGPGCREAIATLSISGFRLIVNAAGVFVVVILASLAFVAFVPMVVGYRPVVVASGSMAPALRAADVVVTDRPAGRLPEGAVIDFRSDDRRLIHRIVEVTETGYRTRGDANLRADPGLVADTDIEGVGVMVVPFVGLPELLLAGGRWVELAGLATTLGVSMVVSSRRWLTGSGVDASTG